MLFFRYPAINMSTVNPEIIAVVTLNARSRVECVRGSLPNVLEPFIPEFLAALSSRGRTSALPHGPASETCLSRCDVLFSLQPFKQIIRPPGHTQTNSQTGLKVSEVFLFYPRSCLFEFSWDRAPGSVELVVILTRKTSPFPPAVLKYV